MAQISNGELGSSVRTKLNDALEVDAEEITTTTYTLVAADNNRMKLLNNTSAITVTVPSGLAAGFLCMLMQKGTGSVSVVAGAGATLNSFSSFTQLAGRYSIATVFRYEANTYVLSGMIA